MIELVKKETSKFFEMSASYQVKCFPSKMVTFEHSCGKNTSNVDYNTQIYLSSYHQTISYTEKLRVR